MLFFFPRGVLDEILNLIESVSEGLPSYFHLLALALDVSFFQSVVYYTLQIQDDAKLLAIGPDRSTSILIDRADDKRYSLGVRTRYETRRGKSKHP